MAKTRAQRKAERRRREEEAAKKRAAAPAAPSEAAAESASQSEVRAQQATQTPVSGDVAEVEAVIETGARTEDYGEHTVSNSASTAAPEKPAEPAVDAEKDSREERRERKRREKEERRKERAKQLRKGKDQPAEEAKPERRRGRVWAFLVSCWAELKKVQWPDRDTLIQASAVTILFVAVAAAYLGALDFAFNWLVKLILPG